MQTRKDRDNLLPLGALGFMYNVLSLSMEAPEINQVVHHGVGLKKTQSSFPSPHHAATFIHPPTDRNMTRSCG
jgi:hypothetical protein